MGGRNEPLGNRQKSHIGVANISRVFFPSRAVVSIRANLSEGGRIALAESSFEGISDGGQFTVRFTVFNSRFGSVRQQSSPALP